MFGEANAKRTPRVEERHDGGWLSSITKGETTLKVRHAYYSLLLISAW